MDCALDGKCINGQRKHWLLFVHQPRKTRLLMLTPPLRSGWWDLVFIGGFHTTLQKGWSTFVWRQVHPRCGQGKTARPSRKCGALPRGSTSRVLVLKVPTSPYWGMRLLRVLGASATRPRVCLQFLETKGDNGINQHWDLKNQSCSPPTVGRMLHYVWAL